MVTSQYSQHCKNNRPTFLPSCRSLEPGETSKIVVIGAGLAGLVCADSLMRRGMNPIILEARPEVGGRVRTVRRRGDHPIELGGEFLGRNHTAWLTLAKDTGLTLKPVRENDQAFRYGDHILSRYEDLRRQDLNRKFQLATTSLAVSIDPCAPWLSPDAYLLDKISVSDWTQKAGLASTSTNFFDTHHIDSYVQGFSAVSSRKYSLLAQLAVIQGGGGASYWSDSDCLRCAEGNDALPDRLADRLGRDRIVTSRRVKQINFGPNPSIVFDSAMEANIRMSADFIVMTAPMNTSQNILFTPHKPLPLLPQMGVAEKYCQRTVDIDQTKVSTYLHFDATGFQSSTWNITDVEGKIFAQTTFLTGASIASKDLQLLSLRHQYFLRSLGLKPPALRDGVATTWGEDPFCLGAYPAPAPGEVTSLGPSLYGKHGVLQFAGDFHYSFGGYMEGAIRSGIRAANHIFDSEQ